jgi:DNA polymerase
MMFIGEAPGADEDLQGRPFVGRAGQLLTKMINAMKLRRDDVYICNILKCRPPGNRDPKPVEIEKCEPILLRQIAIIKPKIICAVGRISGQTLLRTSSPLNALRGKVHDYHGVKFIVMYHPAALLRNPALKPAAWEDLKFLRREYDGMEL